MKPATLAPNVQEVLDGLGPALTALRTSAGKQQKDVSEETGMSRSQVSRYENGHDVPNLVTLLKYLNAVGADFGSLQEAFHPVGDLACAMRLASAIRDVMGDERREAAPCRDHRKTAT